MMREGEKDVSASYCSQETRRLASDYVKVYKIINMSIHVLNRTIKGASCVVIKSLYVNKTNIKRETGQMPLVKISAIEYNNIRK